MKEREATAEEIGRFIIAKHESEMLNRAIETLNSFIARGDTVYLFEKENPEKVFKPTGELDIFSYTKIPDKESED